MMLGLFCDGLRLRSMVVFVVELELKFRKCVEIVVFFLLLFNSFSHTQD